MVDIPASPLPKLRVLLKYIDNPYTDSVHYEAWGWLNVFIEDSETIEPLLNAVWNLEGFVEWYLKSEQAILTQEFPLCEPDESYPACQDRLWATMPDENDERSHTDAEDKLLDDMYEFRSKHSIGFGLSGSGIPGIYITQKQGLGEVSYSEGGDYYADDEHGTFFEPGPWSYRFDLEDFRITIRESINDFLQAWLTWLKTTDYEYAKSEVQRLLGLLNSTTDGKHP